MAHEKPEVPEGYQELLEELSYEVLKQRPSDFIQFSIDFLLSRRGPNGTFITKRTTSEFANDDPLRNNPNLHFNSCPPENQFTNENHSAGVVQRRGAVAAEKFDLDSIDSCEFKKISKTEDQLRRLKNAIKDILLFRELDDDDINALLSTMFEVCVKPGDIIINYGDEGDNFYVIDKGTFSIEIPDGNKFKHIGEYIDSGSFGELALLYNTPRSATITAQTVGSLWAMNQKIFRAIILKNAFHRRQHFEDLLAKVEILETLSTYERSLLIDSLQTRNYSAGETIFSEGEIGNEMFFISKGIVKVEQNKNNQLKLLCELHEGEYFGELALMKKQPRAASIIAKSAIQVAVLDADSFERLLGPCYNHFNRKILSYGEV